jgi:hypothetical protein
MFLDGCSGVVENSTISGNPAEGSTAKMQCLTHADGGGISVTSLTGSSSILIQNSQAIFLK